MSGIKKGRFITEKNLVVSEEAKEAIADLDYFLATKKLRKEDDWQS